MKILLLALEVTESSLLRSKKYLTEAGCVYVEEWITSGLCYSKTIGSSVACQLKLCVFGALCGLFKNIIYYVYTFKVALMLIRLGMYCCV